MTQQVTAEFVPCEICPSSGDANLPAWLQELACARRIAGAVEYAGDAEDELGELPDDSRLTSRDRKILGRAGVCGICAVVGKCEAASYDADAHAIAPQVGEATE